MSWFTCVVPLADCPLTVIQFTDLHYMPTEDIKKVPREFSNGIFMNDELQQI